MGEGDVLMATSGPVRVWLIEAERRFKTENGWTDWARLGEWAVTTRPAPHTTDGYRTTVTEMKR